MSVLSGSEIFRRPSMDLYRKIGIGIVTMIPAFVLGGLVWELFGSWLAVLGLELVVAILCALTIAEKFSSRQNA